MVAPEQSRRAQDRPFCSAPSDASIFASAIIARPDIVLSNDFHPRQKPSGKNTASLLRACMGCCASLAGGSRRNRPNSRVRLSRRFPPSAQPCPTKLSCMSYRFGVGIEVTPCLLFQSQCAKMGQLSRMVQVKPRFNLSSLACSSIGTMGSKCDNSAGRPAQTGFERDDLGG